MAAEEPATSSLRVPDRSTVGQAQGSVVSARAAGAVADNVDWHEVSRLVRLACARSLAVATIE